MQRLGVLVCADEPTHTSLMTLLSYNIKYINQGLIELLISP
jgi:hypothetical protein